MDFSRFIRVDDFPNGDRAMHHEWLKTERQPHFRRLKPILDILNAENASYMIGASPLLMDEEDYAFLNENLKSGVAVMHGFDHAWSFNDWSKITDTWAAGGEFSLLNKEEIRTKYKECKNLMEEKIVNADFSHFIPPFNCYNQDLLDILEENGVKYIHGCSKEHQNYNLGNLNHRGMISIISAWQKTYSDIDVVLRNYPFPSQITLHWIYDLNRQNYLENYKKIAKLFSVDKLS